MTRNNVEAMIQHGGDELAASAFVQSDARIRSEAPAVYEESAALMCRILHYLTGSD